MPVGLFSTKKGDLTNFQLQLVQLANALMQKQDVDKILKYLNDIRDKYIQNVETLDYLNLYPTPDDII
jgi:hypothetical protein